MNTIYLIGDSTCQTNNKDTYPQKGWGQVFKNYVSDKYNVINLAKNGKSTKSFLDDNLFDEVKNNIKKGDFLFIEFGHNDQKIADPSRYASPTKYKENILFFIDIAKKVGATPIVLSPITRRKFIGKTIDITDHEPYRLASKEIAKQTNTLFIDMTIITKKYFEKIGDNKSKEYFMNFDKNIYKNYIEGLNDNTHFRYKGAKKICDLIAKELKNTDYKYILK